MCFLTGASESTVPKDTQSKIDICFKEVNEAKFFYERSSGYFFDHHIDDVEPPVQDEPVANGRVQELRDNQIESPCEWWIIQIDFP